MDKRPIHNLDWLQGGVDSLNRSNRLLQEMHVPTILQREFIIINTLRILRAALGRSNRGVSWFLLRRELWRPVVLCWERIQQALDPDAIEVVLDDDQDTQDTPPAA